MNSNKEFHNESKNQQNRETTRGDGVALQKTQTNLTLTKVVMNYDECGSSGLSCEAGKVGDFVMAESVGCCLSHVFFQVMK